MSILILPQFDASTEPGRARPPGAPLRFGRPGGRSALKPAEYLEFLLRWVEQDVMIWVSEDALGADPKCAKSAGTVNGTYRISVATGASQEPERE